MNNAPEVPLPEAVVLLTAETKPAAETASGPLLPQILTEESESDTEETRSVEWDTRCSRTRASYYPGPLND